MNNTKHLIGVLAVQGDFAAHKEMLRAAGAASIEIRNPVDMASIDGLIIPGGESTTMLKFLAQEGFDEAIVQFASSGRVILGTCAGAIILAREIVGPPQRSLGLIDIAVERNAYGRQVDSFVHEVETVLEGGPLEAVFIRAPRIRRLGPEVGTLAKLGDEPVLVSEGNILAATFHPELTSDQRVHRLFLNRVAKRDHLPVTEIENETIEMGRR
jgi:5'-phosphate synthase pdxT subunit